jgi:hypothetical protein
MVVCPKCGFCRVLAAIAECRNAVRLSTQYFVYEGTRDTHLLVDNCSESAEINSFFRRRKTAAAPQPAPPLTHMQDKARRF